MTDTFRELCAEVLAFHHGEGCYNFSGLNPYDRDNAAFDAWQDIRQRLKSALAQPAPAGGLVERVDRAIVRAEDDRGIRGEARAAVREVAAWLDLVGNKGSANELRREADR
jgi:hypothetical protein